LGNWSRSDLQDQNPKSILEVVMPSPTERARASARLQAETPISDDASLLKVQEQAAEFVREAKRRDASEPDQSVYTVIDAVARNYFRHVVKRRRAH